MHKKVNKTDLCNEICIINYIVQVKNRIKFNNNNIKLKLKFDQK